MQVTVIKCLMKSWEVWIKSFPLFCVRNMLNVESSLCLSTKVVSLAEASSEDGSHKYRLILRNAEVRSVLAEKLLMSVGRRPVTKGFGLENLELKKERKEGISVQTVGASLCSGVYICGDLTGYSLLAHTAVREAGSSCTPQYLARRCHELLGYSRWCSISPIRGLQE